MSAAGEPRDGSVPPLQGVSQIFFATVLGLAVVGYFIGITESSTPVLPARGTARAVTRGGTVEPAYSYRELRSVRRGPNKDWTSLFGSLKERKAAAASVARSDNPRLGVLERRRRLRSFEGAPPVVPHRIEGVPDTACLLCHEKGRWIDGVLAPPMPHPVHTRSDRYKKRKKRTGVPLKSRCKSCHVEVRRRVPVATTFEGRPSWTEPRPRGNRPPKIPHTQLMIKYTRRDCLACHGFETGRPGLKMSDVKQHKGAKTSRSCKRCHVPGRTYR